MDFTYVAATKTLGSSLDATSYGRLILGYGLNQTRRQALKGEDIQVKGRSLLVIGILVAATTVSVVFAAGWRPPPAGSWQCFRTDRFPDPAAERGPTQASAWDPARAADDHVAQVFAQGLNKVAANSAVGTVLTVQLDPPIGARYPAVCVRY